MTTQQQSGNAPVAPPPSFRNPFLDLLGVIDGEVGEGWAEVILEARPDLGNMHGKVHGGVLMAMLDTTMARAAMSRLGFSLSVVSIGVSTNFLRPGSGRLVKTRWARPGLTLQY